MPVKPVTLVFACVALTFAPTGVGAQQGDAAWWDHDSSLRQPSGEVTWTRTSQYIEMRDGVRIAVDIYVPRDLEQPTATILEQTRYRRTLQMVDPARDSAQPAPAGLWAFVEAGYAVVISDVRGAGASFGTRSSEFSDAEILDGRELVDWIVDQPWSNGVVGLTGVSYPGTTSEFTASLGHPAVKAVAPRFSLFDMWADVMAPGGIFLEKFFQRWNSIVDFLDANQLSQQARQTFTGVRPAAPGRTGDSLLALAIAEHANNAGIFANAAAVDARDEPTPDGWTSDDISTHTRASGLRDAAIPVYNMSGWFDGGFGNSAIKRYLTVPNEGSRLTMGPWSHGAGFQTEPWLGPRRTGFNQFGELLRFFDHHLRGIDTGIDDEPPVHYYTMGEGVWKSAERWPVPAEETAWYLAPGSALAAELIAGTSRLDTLVVDTMVGSGATTRWATIAGGGPVDYPDWEDRAGGLISFTSAPLENTMEVTGHPRVILSVRSPRGDANLFAYLEVVNAEGESFPISEGQLRLSYRATGEAPYTHPAPEAYHPFTAASKQPVPRGSMTSVVIELLPVSYRFAVGERIRLTVAGADRDWFRTAPAPDLVEIGLGGEEASRVILPVVQPH